MSTTQKSSEAQNISKGVYKISGDSNCYILKLDETIMIDCGAPEDEAIVKREVERIVGIKNIKKILFTHLHYDHIANFHLFEKAQFYASKDAIEDLKSDPVASVLNRVLANKFSRISLLPFKEIPGLEVIGTPGHTRGSVCFFYKKENILFSGDTLFFHGGIGRTDLPTSVPQRMAESLNKLKIFSSSILCPGHEY